MKLYFRLFEKHNHYIVFDVWKFSFAVFFTHWNQFNFSKFEYVTRTNFTCWIFQFDIARPFDPIKGVRL